MNIEQYEQQYHSLYSEFAGIIEFILDQAIAASDGPVPQSIQSRAKEPDHLRPKLAARGLLVSDAIEKEIKDLAGARLIFYTNTDVDRFLNSRLIPENFEVDWNETRIHQPDAENAETQYRAIHYTVSLGTARTALPEYQRFGGLRCEIQIQTILIHAWAETAHDILYKPPSSVGFGDQALAAIKKRMARVMDDFLVPAGYELQKVQHDFERLMQGKSLFDRGMIETLEQCDNNNDRYDILTTINEYVLPNYDDIDAVYPEIQRVLVEVVEAARKTETIPIETAFGPISGKKPSDITRVAVRILASLRYVDVEGTFLTLTSIYMKEDDQGVRKQIIEVIKRLSQYDLAMMRRFGLAAQLVLTDVAERFDEDARAARRPILLTLWREILSAEVIGTTRRSDSYIIESGAVHADDALRKVRAAAINGLIALYDQSESLSEKRSIIAALNGATRLPYQANYTNDLAVLVAENTIRILELLKERFSGMSYELLEHVEHNLLLQYRRARPLADADDDRFGTKKLSGKLVQVILGARDAINFDPQFVRYKTLVGFEGVIPEQWNDDNIYMAPDEYRLKAGDEYIASVSAETENQWLELLELCAATESEDMATFPVFSQFVVRLSKLKPESVLRFIARASPAFLNFLPAVLTGLAESHAVVEYKALIEGFVSEGRHLGALARHMRILPSPPFEVVERILEKAIPATETIAVIECLALTVQHYDSQQTSPIQKVFIPALRYLTSAKDARWVRGVYFQTGAKAFFHDLSAADAKLVLQNLLHLRSIEHEAESILGYIAEGHPAEVWAHFGERLEFKPEGDERYEAIPYELDGLAKVLEKDADLAIQTVLRWHEPDDPLFRFNGGRLLHAVFPDFPEPFAQALLKLTNEGPDDAIGFTLGILENYRGEPATHEVLKAIVDRLPDGDPRWSMLEIALLNTGVVSGEFGIAEAYRAKKALMTAWLDDERSKVKQFAEAYIRRLDQMIASEQRAAEQRKELRKREFDDESD